MRAGSRALLAGLAVALSIGGQQFATAADGSASGCIHGTVTTRGGTRSTGLIRWGGQEAFWDDLFNSAKIELPYASYAEPARQPDDERWWQVMGRRLFETFDRNQSSSLFTARFGDISRIEVVGDREAIVTMRSGTSYHVRGYANDVGATIEVTDAEGGRSEIEWSRVDVVEFSAVPANAELDGYRLHGTVDTGSRQFVGFIQWDEDECLSGDRLDGDVDGERLSIPFSSIEAIERSSSSRALVSLDDGRELVLSGTNDVNADNRGILVEDPRYGRVKVPWARFRRVEFSRIDESGRSYEDFALPTSLRGTVTTTSGGSFTGAIHYDLDESETWEMLDGDSDGISYSIPFGRIEALERRDGSTIVSLRGGETIRLGASHDVGDRNAGIVVEPDEGDESFLPWRDVRRVELAQP